MNTKSVAMQISILEARLTQASTEAEMISLFDDLMSLNKELAN